MSALGLGLVAAGLAVCLFADGAGTLSAGGTVTSDLDGDGLPSGAEALSGSSDLTLDSDSDGFNDVEEVARGTNPALASSMPTASMQAISQVTFEENGVLNYCSVMYLRAGVSLPHFEFGVVLNGALVPLPPSVYTAITSFGTRPGKDVGDTIYVVRTSFPTSLVTSLGSVSLYSSVSQTDANDPGGTIPDGLAATTLLMAGGVPMQAQQAPAGVGGGLGVIYRPLTPSSDLGGGWSSGKVCWQQSVLQGTVGLSLLYEVGNANCEDMDSYCDPSACSGLNGSTLTIVDPAALAGG